MKLEPDHWESCAWQCPECSQKREDEIHSLVLIRSADRDVSKVEIWHSEGDVHSADIDTKAWLKANNTARIVGCPNCESVFDVSLEKRDDLSL